MKITAFLFLVFGLLSLGLGIAMITDKTLLTQFGETPRAIFIGILFGYGLFRIWSAISSFRNPPSRQAP